MGITCIKPMPENREVVVAGDGSGNITMFDTRSKQSRFDNLTRPWRSVSGHIGCAFVRILKRISLHLFFLFTSFSSTRTLVVSYNKRLQRARSFLKDGHQQVG